VAGLAVVTGATFSGVFQLGFVFDDAAYVVNNHHVRGGLTLEGLGWALTTFFFSNWHPLTWLSHMVDVELFALRPAGHHATSLILHTANGICLFGVLRALTGSTWRSATAAALFLVHPLRVESVAWVSERKDVLSVLLGLLTVAAYVAYVRKPHPLRYLPVVLALAAGLAAKPMLVTLPLALLLLDYWPLGRISRGVGAPRWRLMGHLLLEKLPLLALAAAGGAVAFVAQARGGSMLAETTLPLPARMENAVLAYARYLFKTLWPQGLSPWYPLPEGGPAVSEVRLAVAFLVVVTACCLSQLRRRPWLGVGWLWFVGTLVPVIGLVKIGLQAMADRYTYLPHVGLLTSLVWCCAECGGKAAGKAARQVAGAALVAALAAATLRQVPHWRDDAALYGHAVATVPGNWFMLYNLATTLEKKGSLAEAAALYEEALRLHPTDSYAHFNLAGILVKHGQTEAALAHYRAALHYRPGDPDTHHNLGVLLLSLGRRDEAASQFREALRLRPDHPQARLGLARALAGR